MVAKPAVDEQHLLLAFHGVLHVLPPHLLVAGRSHGHGCAPFLLRCGMNNKVKMDLVKEPEETETKTGIACSVLL